jgi:hypothetical protein
MFKETFTILILGALERFFDDTEKVEKIREIFTGLYSLDKVATFPLYLANNSRYNREFCFDLFSKQLSSSN